MQWRLATVERLVARVLQIGLLGFLAVGIVTRNLSVTINALLAFAVTLVPAVLARDFRIHLDAGLTLFVTVAVFAHMLGMAAFYGTVWWWDHLTHTLSAAIVAGAGYAVTRAFDEHSDAIRIPPRLLPVYVVAFTLAMGLVWEGLELGARVVTDALGLDVIWIEYGPWDTALDLVFDTLGGLIVALLGTRRLQALVENVRAWFDYRFGTE